MEDKVYNEIVGKSRPTPFAASGLVLLAALGLWLSGLLALLAPASANREVLLNALYYLPFIGLPMLLYARRRPGLSEALRLKPISPLAMLLAGMLGLWSVYVASLLTSAWDWLLSLIGLEAFDGIAVPDSPRALTLSIVTMAALPAVFEELLFRGAVFSAWESRGTAFGIGVSALMFALLHGNLFGWPAYLLVGAISAYLVFALDSLYAGIAYHTVYNAACLVISYLAKDAGAEDVAMNGSLLLSIAIDSLMIAGMMALMLRAVAMRRRLRHIEPIPRIRRPLTRGDKRMLWLAVGAMGLTTLIALWMGG